MGGSERVRSSVSFLEKKARSQKIQQMVEGLADIGEPGSDPLGHDNSVEILKTAVEIRELVIESRKEPAVPGGVLDGE